MTVSQPSFILFFYLCGYVYLPQSSNTMWHDTMTLLQALVPSSSRSPSQIRRSEAFSAWSYIKESVILLILKTKVI